MSGGRRYRKRVQRSTQRDVFERWPLVEVKAADAFARLRGEERVLICSHYGPGPSRRPLLCCSDHVPAGLMCPACLTAHVGRHPWELEHRCDQCGGLGHTMTATIPRWSMVAFAARTIKGDRVRVTGDLHVGGLGVCQDCSRVGRAA